MTLSIALRWLALVVSGLLLAGVAAWMMVGVYLGTVYQNPSGAAYVVAVVALSVLWIALWAAASSTVRALGLRLEASTTAYAAAGVGAGAVVLAAGAEAGIGLWSGASLFIAVHVAAGSLLGVVGGRQLARRHAVVG